MTVPQNISDRALTALAILKVNADREGTDYISHFVPFVVDVLRERQAPEVALPEVHEALKEAFGLCIPLGALSTIIGRAAKQGYLRKEHDVWIRTQAVSEATPLGPLRAELEREQRELSEGLIKFARALEVELSLDEASDWLLAYVERTTVPILAASVTGEEVVIAPEASPKTDYIVSRFVADLAESRATLFPYLERLVKGSMLATALYYPEVGNVAQAFGELDAYLDTRLILRAIGLGGEVMQSSTEMTLRLFHEEGGNLKCFDDTLLEVRGVLEAVRARLRRGTSVTVFSGEALLHATQVALQPSDIDLLLATLERRLGVLKIKVVERPAAEIKLTMDEAKFEALLRAAIPNYKDEALRHDLDAVTSIYRLRRGFQARNLENARAVFVTSNRPLAVVSAQFVAEEYGNDGHIVVPPCLLARTLESLVWIKKPNTAPDLPRVRILADAYAGLQPPDALWEKYLVEVERLRVRGELTEDDVFALRYTLDARQALMDLTLGEQDAFSEGTLQEVVARARESISSTEIAARQLAETEAAELRAERFRRDERVAALASRAAHYGAQAIGIIALVVLGVLMIFATLGGPTAGGWALVAIWVLALLAYLNLAFGWYLQPQIRSLEGRIERLLARWLNRLLDPE